MLLNLEAKLIPLGQVDGMPMFKCRKGEIPDEEWEYLLPLYDVEPGVSWIYFTARYGGPPSPYPATDGL